MSQSQLENLPGNVLARIASALDRPSAIALACTSATLQPYGEAHAWRTLNLSIHWQYYTPDLTGIWHQLLGGKRLLLARHAMVWENDHYSTTSPTIVAEFMQDLIHILKTHPPWLLSMRELNYDLDYDLVPGFIELLKLVRPTLTTLRFFRSEIVIASPRNKNYPPLETMFIELDTPFTALRCLQIPLSADDWDARIRAILRLTPNLRTLRLIATEQYSPGWGTTNPFKPASAEGDWPTLRLLEILEIEQMSEHFQPMLLELVRSASLQHVGLRDPARQWTREDGECVMNELGQMDSLEYLGVSSDCRAALEVDGRFEKVKRLSYVDRTLIELPDLNNIDIPHMPNLRILYWSSSMIGGDCSVVWPWVKGSYHLPAPIYPILPSTIQQLRQIPRLEMIQFTGFPEKEHNPIALDDWNYWGSQQAFENNERAILIRTYHHYKPLTGQEEVFTHCRAYTAHRTNEEDGLIYRTKHVWDQYTDYEGVCVPANVLVRVYDAMQGGGGDGGRGGVVWTVPGRGLRLGEAAWEVLNAWRNPGELRGTG